MKTLEMMNACKGTKRKFKSKDMFYTDAAGFRDDTGSLWAGNSFCFLNDVFEIDNWEEVFDWVDFDTARACVIANDVEYISENNEAMFLYNDELIINWKGNIKLEVTLSQNWRKRGEND